MTPANRSVPFPVKPWPEERLTHYLARVTTHNHYLAVAWLLEAAGLLSSLEKLNTGLRRALHDPAAAAPLGALLNIDTRRVEEMQLTNVNASTDKSLVTLGHLSVRRDLVVPLRRRYCPACEEERVSDSELIDIVYYLACHRHHCRIIDSCQCGQPLDWNSGAVPFCSRCGDSRPGPVEPAHPELVGLAQHLAELHDGLIPSEESVYRDLPSLVALLLDFSGAIDTRSALGRFEYGAERIDYNTLAEHARFSWRWLQSETSFTCELRSWMDHRRRTWPDLPCRGWFVDIQRVVDGVTDVTCREILQRWLANAASAIADVTPPPADSPSPEDACVTVRWAAWILGTSEHNLRRLIGSRRLPSRFALEERKRSDRLVKLRDLNRLCNELRAVTMHARGSSWTRFGDAIRTFNQDGRGYGIEAAIAALLSGRLSGHWIPGTGLEGLCVKPDHKHSEPSSSEKNDDSMLSIAQSAAELGIYPDALYRLIKANILVTRSWRVRGQERRCLSRTQLQSFRETYVFAGELARAWGIGRTSLTDRLIDQGIEPVSGPRIDGGLVYLFRRSDAERIDPVTVQSHTPFRSRAGRPSKGTPKGVELSSATVCARLEITPQALGSLVKKGYLMEAAASRFAGNRRYFDKAQVDAYAARFKENPLLIEIDEAAGSLGCTRKAFLRKYVLTGLITPIDDGAKRQYVGRDSLTLISRGDIELMPLAGAAEKLGVSKMKLKNLRTTGRIKTDVRRVCHRDVHYYSVLDCQKALQDLQAKLETVQLFPESIDVL